MFLTISGYCSNYARWKHLKKTSDTPLLFTCVSKSDQTLILRFECWKYGTENPELSRDGEKERLEKAGFINSVSTHLCLDSIHIDAF